MSSRRSSSLVVYERISPNVTTPRPQKIKRLTPHCVAGNLSIERTLGLSRMITPSRPGLSVTYAIGSDGRIGLGAPESSSPWTTSSSKNDNQAITFEIANNTLGPDWRMSDLAINAWLDLATDICKFYGYKKVKYLAKPDNITTPTAIQNWIESWEKPDEMIITLHRWYAAKSCPGPYFIRQLPWLVKELNSRLSGAAKNIFYGEGVTPPKPVPPPVPVFKPYIIKITAMVLNVREGPGIDHPVVKTLRNDHNTYTIVAESIGKGAKKWGKLKSGLGWIALDFTSKV